MFKRDLKYFPYFLSESLWTTSSSCLLFMDTAWCAVFYSELSLDPEIQIRTKSCRFYLHNISKIQPFISIHNSKTHVQTALLDVILLCYIKHKPFLCSFSRCFPIYLDPNYHLAFTSTVNSGSASHYTFKQSPSYFLLWYPSCLVGAP